MFYSFLKPHCRETANKVRCVSPQVQNRWFVSSSPVAQVQVWVVDEAGAQLRRVSAQRLLDAGEALRHFLTEPPGNYCQVCHRLHRPARRGRGGRRRGWGGALAIVVQGLPGPSRVETCHYKVVHQLGTFLLCHAACLPSTAERGRDMNRKSFQEWNMDGKKVSYMKPTRFIGVLTNLRKCLCSAAFS